jgi:hypothetical protein
LRRERVSRAAGDGLAEGDAVQQAAPEVYTRRGGSGGSEEVAGRAAER